MGDDAILPHELQALTFLGVFGPHTIGIIDSEEKLCAAMTFVHLRDAGFVSMTDFGDGMVQAAITIKGRAILDSVEA